MKLIYAIVINLFIVSFCLSQNNKIKNIFDPNNVKSENTQQIKVTKNFDFILYGIINTKKVKKVLLKPKIITSEVRKRMGKSKYISLKVGEEFQNIKLISIDNDTAKFKKGDKIIAMRVFQSIKNDRIKIATSNSPTIINNAPLPVSNSSEKNTESKNNFVVHSSKKNSKNLNKSFPVNNKNKKNKKVTNPFLEMLKKVKHRKQNSNNSSPPVNPFLELLRKGRK